MTNIAISGGLESQNTIIYHGEEGTMEKNKEVKVAWLGKPEARILSIRAFRKYIDTISFEEAVKLVQKNWNNSPKIKKFQFELQDITHWPTPWELFSQTIFCANSQVVGAFYTLLLSEHVKKHDFSLAIIDDVIQGINGAIVLDNFPLTNLNVVTMIKRENILKKLEG